MLGSVADAEDIVQEAFLALQEAEDGAVVNVKAYVCKTATNLCINKLKSARRRRETYVGPWLPEPYVSSGTGERTPLDEYIRKESLTTAYLLLIQQLSDTERTVFLLREALHYSFREIARLTDKTEGNCRQIYYRAKKSIGAAPTERGLPPSKRRSIAEAFAQALVTGNLSVLMDIMTNRTMLQMDGGGKTDAALKPITGAALIVRLFQAVRPEVPPQFTAVVRDVNGEPGIVLQADGRVFAVLSFRFGAGAIRDVYIAMNPEKLRHLQPGVSVESR